MQTATETAPTPKAARRITKGRVIKRLRELFDSSSTVFAITKTHANASVQNSIRYQFREFGCTLFAGKLSLARMACPFDNLQTMFNGDIALVFCPHRTAALNALRIVWNTTEKRYLHVGETAQNTVTLKQGQTLLMPSHTTFLQSFGVSSIVQAGRLRINYTATVLPKGKKATPELVRLLKLLGLPTVNVSMTPVFYYDVETQTLDLSLPSELKLDPAEFEALKACSEKVFMPTIARAMSLVQNLRKLAVIEAEDTFSDSDTDTDTDTDARADGVGLFDDDDDW